MRKSALNGQMNCMPQTALLSRSRTKPVGLYTWRSPSKPPRRKVNVVATAPSSVSR